MCGGIRQPTPGTPPTAVAVDWRPTRSAGPAVLAPPPPDYRPIWARLADQACAEGLVDEFRAAAPVRQPAVGEVNGTCVRAAGAHVLAVAKIGTFTRRSADQKEMWDAVHMQDLYAGWRTA